MTTKRAKPEQALQIAVAAFLRAALRPPTIWSAFPAGGGGRVRGAFLKAMGLQAGWPDILVVVPARRAANPYLIGVELKAPKGRTSTEQKLFALDFAEAGAFYRVCRSVDEVESYLRSINVPLFASCGTKGPLLRPNPNPPASAGAL